MHNNYITTIIKHNKYNNYKRRKMSIKYINHKGYEITVRRIPHNGMYELSTMVENMGEEYREHMLSDNIDKSTLDNFIKRIKRNK